MNLMAAVRWVKLRRAVLCCAVLCCVVLCCVVLCCAVLCRVSRLVFEVGNSFSGTITQQEMFKIDKKDQDKYRLR